MPLRAPALAALGLLVLASPAAAVTTPNLLQNPGAEAGPGAQDASTTQLPPGWQLAGDPSAVAYGAPNFPTTTIARQIGGESNFFSGGTGAGGLSSTLMVQEIDLTPQAALIDSGKATATVSAALGGFAGQEDNASVFVSFFDPATGGAGSVAQLQPVTNADRGNQTTLLPRTTCTALVAGARRAAVQVLFQRNAGAYNDGYADNVSVTLSDEACPAGGGGQPLEPPAPPEPGVSGNADVVKGKVLVKVPGSNDFVELKDLSKLPVGAEVDATKGTVELQTAAGSSGQTQTGRFFSGSFKMIQPRSGAFTELRLMGKLDKCPKGRKLQSAAKRRRLWGDGKGRFRTRGRNASASVRGTRWYTEDSCRGTLVRVTRGSVVVRDFGKKRSFTLKAPGRYIAKG